MIVSLASDDREGKFSTSSVFVNHVSGVGGGVGKILSRTNFYSEYR